MPSNRDALLKRIEAARELLAVAERDLQQTLELIEVRTRAAKVTMDAALHDSFAKLKAAQAELASVEMLLEESDG